MRIRVLGFEGCPNAAETLERVRRVVRDQGLDAPVDYVEVPDPETARCEGFLGSPRYR